MRVLKKILGIVFVLPCVVVCLVVLGIFPGRAVPVLMYHHVTSKDGFGPLEVSKKIFEMQMGFLKQHHYEVVLPDVLLRVLAGKEAIGKKVVLTFDDGYEDIYTNALPVLDSFGFKGTFFIVTDWVGKIGYLNWDQIRELQKRGHVIGSHSTTHPLLTEITIAKAKEEIYNSKRLLQENLGKPVEFFCYPTTRFNKDIRQIVKEAGYKGAFTAAPGWAFSNRDPFAAKRIRVSEKADSAYKFWWRVAGYYNLLRERKARRMTGWS